MRQKYLKLYSTCKPVRGKERGALYILDERRIEVVPLSLIDALELLSKKSIEMCKEEVTSPEVLEDYITFLIAKRAGFITEEPDRFMAMDDFYETPSHVFLSSIALDENSTYDLKSFVDELDDLLCKHVELRLLHSSLSVQQLVDILDMFEGKTIRSIELHIKKMSERTAPEVEKTLERCKKLSTVVLYSMASQKTENNVIYTTERFDTIASFPFNEKALYVNIRYFAECQKFNPFYNKKVSVDQYGILKNNLICKESFNRYCPKTNTIAGLIQNKDFTRFWSVTPDMIEDIKDSELRYAVFPTYEIDEINGKYYFKKD